MMNKTEDSKLRNALERRGIKPADFARLMDVSSQTITHWLKRGVPHSKVLEVASRLDIAVSEISQQNISGNIKLKKILDTPTPKTAKEFLDFLFDDISDMDEEEILKLAGGIELMYSQKKKLKSRS